MKLRTFASSITLAVFLLPVAATAQLTGAVPKAQTEIAAPTSVPIKLAANTRVELSLNSGLTTRSNNAGDVFSLTVSQDVMADGQIVVPKGARAVGLVTYAKGNGSFGKSGKMELTFKYIEFGGKQIPLDGVFYQEGAGNTGAAVGAIFAAGVIGGLVVKGHSVDIVANRDFNAMIKQDVPFVFLNGKAVLDPAFNPEIVSMQTETDKERKKRMKAAEKARKV